MKSDLSPAKKYPKYINAYHDRHGKLRTYYRRKKFSARIYGEPLSEGWWANYHRVANTPGVEHAVKSHATIRCENFLLSRLARMRSRAKHKGIDFLLIQEDITEMCKKSKGRCELSNIHFDFEKKPGIKNAYAPSIDRINSSGAYSLENCRLVLYAVNVALNEWGDEQLLTISRALLEGAPNSKRLSKSIE